MNQYFRFNLNKNGQKIFYLNPSAKNNVGTLRLVAQLPQILKSTPFEIVSSRTPQAPLRPLRSGKKNQKPMILFFEADSMLYSLSRLHFFRIIA